MTFWQFDSCHFRNRLLIKILNPWRWLPPPPLLSFLALYVFVQNFPFNANQIDVIGLFITCECRFSIYYPSISICAPFYFAFTQINQPPPSPELLLSHNVYMLMPITIANDGRNARSGGGVYLAAYYAANYRYRWKSIHSSKNEEINLR